MRVRVYTVADQKKALNELVGIVEPDTVNPMVRNAADAITADCDQRDDECEVQAIFNAVKYGSDAVPGLESGMKYMSDPRWADFFTSPSRILKQLSSGHRIGDCDDFSSLIAGLLGSLGFVAGFRAWGPKKGEYTHVYPVVGLPKNDWETLVGLDATVDESEAGWEPPGGVTLTALMDGT